MNYGLAFRYLFDDKKRVQKLLLGGLIALVPILNFVIGGYLIQVIRNIRDKLEYPLPEWGEEFGAKWVRGLLLYVILFIYMIPLVILQMIPVMIIVPMMLTSISTGALAGANQNAAPEALTALFGGFLGTMGFAFVVAFVIFFLISFVYMLAFYYFINSVITRFAMTGEFKEAFNFRELFNYIKINPKKYTLTWLVVVGTFIGVYIAVALVNVIVSVIGFIPFVGWCLNILLIPIVIYAMGVCIFYAMSVQGNLLGQLYNANTV
ncbi:MAG: DUF4013 domain-containing protein [Actinobacteria bacterium]|nr:DUF4013 domain-containing protein [Actinomycetota bacterium]